MNKLLCALLLMSFGVPTATHTSSRPELWAFTGPWDARSDSSLRVNARHLNVAVTGWIGLDSVTAQPILPSPFPDTLRLTSGAPRRMALVTSWHGNRFHPSSIRSLANNAERRAHVASALARHAESKHYAGLVLDFESLERSDLTGLLTVIKSIADSAHAHGIKTVVVAVPATDTAAYPGKPIAGVADLVMPMLYDQHWSTSGPGSISSPAWVRSTLAKRIAEVGAGRIVAALPTYGYQWSAKGGAAAEVVSLTDARRIASQSNVRLERDAATNTMRAVNPGVWEIWVTDSQLLATLVRQAEDAGVRRIALWRIGQEDPTLWRTLGR